MLVSILDVPFDGFRRVASTRCGTDYFGEDALFGAILFQSVSPSQNSFVIGRDDEVFAAFIAVVHGFVHKVVVRYFG